MRETLTVVIGSLLAAWGTIANSAPAVTGSANLSIGVTPESPLVACDIGPSALIPIEAQNAGLTHCIANFDFSNSDPSTWTLHQSDLAAGQSWFDCFGEQANNPNILWHGGSAGIREISPCNITQIPDPMTGKLVMDFRWVAGDPAYTAGGSIVGPQANQVSLQMNNDFIAWPFAPTVSVGNYYIETVSRMQSLFSEDINAGCCSDVYTWGFINSPDGGGFEVDIVELQSNIGSGGGVASGNCCGMFYWTNWGPNRIIGIPNYSNSDPHNYGALLTSDGKTDQRICMFIDDILQNPQGCQPADPNGNHFDNRSYITVGTGSFLGTAQNTIDFNVSNVIVWSCDSYKTSQCNGSTLHNQTLPSGQVLSFYQ